MKLSRFVLFVFASLVTLPTMAAVRVFVSGSGMDVGTCPITAPCRNFSYAITQVSPGGEIIALDTAGYGPVTITFSVSIIAAPGATAFIAGSGLAAILVNPAATDLVTIRGLALTATTGSYGVIFQTGQSLNVENCLINGFPSSGVLLQRNMDNGKPRLQILNSVFRNNGEGVTVVNTGAGSPAGGPPTNLSYVTIANTAFTGQTIYGVDAADNARIAIADSVFAGNNNGVWAVAGADYSVPEVNLDRCTFSRNVLGIHSGNGFGGQIPRGLVRITNCLITGNDTGISTATDGSILSKLSSGVVTNTIEGNTINGVPTGNYTAQ
jgi:parallel beta helix pectate lyase-like protein